MNSPARKLLKVERFVAGALGTNCYLAYDAASKKGVLVDPAEYVAEISEFIKNNGIEVLFTVNTHGHADHIRGNAGFAFPVLIHELDAGCLSDPVKNLSVLSDDPVTPVNALRFLKDGDTVDIGEISLEVIHTPGHTPGGISLWYNDILFSGDVLFYEGIGRTDLPGGSYEAIIRSIKGRLFALPDDVRVLPGHGPETTIGHEKRNNPFLRMAGDL